MIIEHARATMILGECRTCLATGAGAQIALLESRCQSLALPIKQPAQR